MDKNDNIFLGFSVVFIYDMIEMIYEFIALALVRYYFRMQHVIAHWKNLTDLIHLYMYVLWKSFQGFISQKRLEGF